MTRLWSVVMGKPYGETVYIIKADSKEEAKEIAKKVTDEPFNSASELDYKGPIIASIYTGE